MAGFDPEQRVTLCLWMVCTKVWAPDPRARLVAAVFVAELTIYDVDFLAALVNVPNWAPAGAPTLEGHVFTIEIV